MAHRDYDTSTLLHLVVKYNPAIGFHSIGVRETQFPFYHTFSHGSRGQLIRRQVGSFRFESLAVGHRRSSKFAIGRKGESHERAATVPLMILSMPPIPCRHVVGSSGDEPRNRPHGGRPCHSPPSPIRNSQGALFPPAVFLHDQRRSMRLALTPSRTSTMTRSRSSARKTRAPC